MHSQIFASASEYGDFNKAGTINPPVNGTAAEILAFNAEQAAAAAEVAVGQGLYPYVHCDVVARSRQCTFDASPCTANSRMCMS